MNQENHSADGTGTVRLHRVLRAPPERVYKAFIDKPALERWVPPYGFTGTIHEIDVRVGGGYRMSFTNFGTGNGHSFTVKFVELVPNRRIRHTDRFDDANLPGEMRVTVDLVPVVCGTELLIEQAGIPAVIPVAMCYLGWQESLEQLARLVEPDIPDNG
ncbi:MAG: SRPBCC family protein [Burkholderiaceae bacterium]